MLTKEQKEFRRSGIGGSDVGGILGASRFSTPLSVYAEKLGIFQKEETSQMEMGHIMEPVIADIFMKKTGKKVHNVTEAITSKRNPLFFANLDRRVVGEQAGLEIKNPSQWVDGLYDGTAPEENILQCQHYMAVTGYPSWYLAVLIGGNDFRWFTVERDDELISIAHERCLKFWQDHVVPKKPPEPTGKDIDRQILSVLYNEGPDSTLLIYLNKKQQAGDKFKLGEKAQKLLVRLDEAKLEVKLAEGREASVKNQILLELGGLELANAGTKDISFRKYFKKSLNQKGLQLKYPAIYQEFLEETSYRQLKILNSKGE